MYKYRLIYSYISKQLIIPFISCFLGFFFIFLLSSIHNELEDISPFVSTTELILYFLARQSEQLTSFFPLCSMLAVLYAYFTLNKNMEITALKAAGISLIKLSVPAIFLGIVLSLVTLLNNEYIQPKANSFCQNIKNNIKAKKNNENQDLQIRNYAKKSPDNIRSWSITHSKGKILGVQIIELDKEGNLSFSLKADNYSYKDNTWTFYNSIYQHKNNNFIAKSFKEQQLSLEENEQEVLYKKNNYNSKSLTHLHKMKQDPLITAKNRLLIESNFYHVLGNTFLPLIAAILAVALASPHLRNKKVNSFVVGIFILILFYIAVQIILKFCQAGHMSSLIGIGGAYLILSFYAIFSFIKVR